MPLLLGLWCLGLGLAASAQAACPADSEEIGRTTRADQTVFRCRCRGERLYYAGACVAPEDAALTTRALAVVTGTAFSAGAVLQAWARAQNWPIPAILYWDFATLEAKFGRYQRALAWLAATRTLVKPNEVLVTVETTLARLQAYREKELRRYFQDYPVDDLALVMQEQDYQATKSGLASWLSQTDCDALCFAKDKRALYFRALTDAALARESGNYSSAIAKYSDARRIADLAKLKPARRRTANAGIVWSRQLRASWAERQNPRLASAWKSYNRIRRHDAAAARAEMLGLHLSQAGQGRAAIEYLEEAWAYYQTMDPKRAPYVAREIARLKANPAANVLAPDKGEGPLTIYTNVSSQTAIMFDAMEYGKGDWSRSIRYLEAAHGADPENKKIFGALNYVRGLSAAK
ncbi:MAG: hypothetical protein ACTSUY_11680 [Alphaproteobacteria bacterium]